MAFIDNIKEITPQLSLIKTGTPILKIGNDYIVGGIGGNFIPGNAASSLSSINIAAGYITISDSVITVHNVTDGTTSTTDKLYIADTGVLEPEYLSGDTAPVQLFKVYKCTAVSDSTWAGYLYDISTPGLDAVLNTMLFKAATPTVGSYYNEDATILVKPYSTRSDLVVYVPMVKSASIDLLGTSLSSNAVNFTNADGLDCCQFSGDSNCYIAPSYRGLSGDSPWSWSIWCKQNYRGLDMQVVLHCGRYYNLLGTGLAITNTGAYHFFLSSLLLTNQYDSYKWHNLACVYNGTIVKAYVDGLLVGAAERAYNIGYQDGGFQIGRSVHSVVQQPFNGYIRDLKIYNTVLTPLLIASLYNRLSSRITNS